VPLFFVVFLVGFFVVFIFEEIAVLPYFFLFLVFIFVEVFGDDVQMDGVYLRNFQLRFALRATEDFAFLNFVFVDVDFGGTFWATDHGSILRIRKASVAAGQHTTKRIIYPAL
jgi:hypothetical protein